MGQVILRATARASSWDPFCFWFFSAFRLCASIFCFPRVISHNSSLSSPFLNEKLGRGARPRIIKREERGQRGGRPFVCVWGGDCGPLRRYSSSPLVFVASPDFCHMGLVTHEWTEIRDDIGLDFNRILDLVESRPILVPIFILIPLFYSNFLNKLF